MSRHDVDDAVARRFLQIRGRLKEREGEYLYGGRCLPENLGWRFRQNLCLKLHERGGITWEPYPELAEEIEAGKHDGMIEYTWHDAAAASWYYTNEKDWGRNDEDY